MQIKNYKEKKCLLNLNRQTRYPQIGPQQRRQNFTLSQAHGYYSFNIVPKETKCNILGFGLL